jgi:glycosyltransferase involved in cell wall biosynthesis
MTRTSRVRAVGASSPVSGEGTGGSVLRVLQVCTKDLGGGAELSAWNLHRMYRRMGHTSWLAVGKKLSDDPDVLEIPRLEPGNSWTRFFRRLQAARGGQLPRPARKVLGTLAWLGEPARFIDERLLADAENFQYPGTRRLLTLPPLPPTLLHCHNLHGNYFDLRLLPRFSRVLPTILNLRDEWLITGHCAYTMGCSRWRTGCGACPDLTIYPPLQRDSTAFNWRRRARIFARSRLYVTAPSQWLLDRATASMLPALDRRVIPNGIDLDVFCPGDRRKAREKLRIREDARVVVVAVHNRFKDRSLAEAATARLEPSPRGAPLLFLLLGPAGEGRPHGAGEIRYAGFVKEPSLLADHYRAADVYLHTSRAEAFGKTIIEAMACGTPVVAVGVDAVREVVEDGRTGIVVPSREPEAVAAALQAVLAEPDRADHLGAEARRTAASRYGLDQQARSFLSWYTEVTADWKSWRGREPGAGGAWWT